MDRAVLDFAVDHRTRELTRLARMAVRAGGSTRNLVLALLAFLVIVAVTRAWRVLGATTLAFAAATVVNAVLKLVISRPRPPDWASIYDLHDSAMPSTHATRTAAVAVAILLTVRWRSGRARAAWAVVAGLLLALIGAAMVYLGVHWFTDVIVGWALGAALGYGAARAADAIAPRPPDRCEESSISRAARSGSGDPSCR